MRRFLSLLVMVLVSAAVWANVWTPETLPVPKNTTDSTQVSYVSNPDGVLSQAEVDSINAKFFLMEKNQGVRGLVVAVEEINPDDPYEFTISVANKYGIGGKTNTGIIVMVATVSRAVSIQIGDGMEKFITDAQCSHIRRNIMTPLLKEGKWGAGILAACDKIQSVVSGETELNPEDDDEEGDGAGNILLWMGVGIGGLVGAGMYSARKKRECPKCKKHNYKIKVRQIALAKGEEGAVSMEEREAELQAKLLAMRMQKNESIMNAMKAYHEGSMEESTLTGILSNCMAKCQEALEMTLASVNQNVAAAAIKTATEKQAFNNEKKNIKKSSLRNSNGIYRKVAITDVYCCPDCGYEGRVKGTSTAEHYALGLFTGGAYGAIVGSSAGRSSGGGSILSGGSSHRSSGSSHSWGSSGGGHFSGGGSSGRF